MSLHDDYARLTPFELLFADPADAEALWAAVSEESEGRGADVHDPQAFVTMGTVTDFIRSVEGDEAPSEAILQYGALAFQAMHQARAGTPVYLLSIHAARYLVEGAPPGDPEPPTPAGYLQLPRHLFWLEDGSEVPQSVDGVFWKVSVAGRGEGALLHTLLATSVRPDRGGVGVVPLPEAPLADAPAWLAVDVRGDGADFGTALPGAEIDRLYAFAAAGEVLKLLARFFAHLRNVPAAASRKEPVDEAGSGVSPGKNAPEPSALPYVRVNLEE